MIFDNIVGFIQNYFDSIPKEHSLIISLFSYTIFLAVYSVFIWKFYKFLAKKDILELNLRQYNFSENPQFEKTIAIALYTIEYIIILPFLVLFWFTILSLFILLLSETISIEHTLLISAAIISSTRITAYISEDLSKDIAKIFPFTVLATFLLNPNFFKISSFLGKVLEIPILFKNILFFLGFIFVIEFILRILYAFYQSFYSLFVTTDEN